MSKFDGPYVLIQAMHQERERIIRALGLPYPPDEGFCQNGYPDLADRVISELEELKLLRADYADATAELDRIRENNDAIISGSLASHLAAAEVEDAIREAFDAGARAMRDAVLEPDIANLPGRPE